MSQALDILKGVELLSGTITFFAILAMLAFFAYAVLVRLKEERFKEMGGVIDRHFRAVGLVTFALFLVLAFLFYALVGK